MMTRMQLLRVYLNEGDRFDGRPAYAALVERLRAAGASGATVFKGIEGFGSSGTLRSARVFDLSTDLPIVVEAVESAEKIAALLPIVREVLSGGIVTLEEIEILQLAATRGEG